MLPTKIGHGLSRLSTFAALSVNSAKGLSAAPGCHVEPIRCAQCKLREGSGAMGTEMLRCAQHDSGQGSPSPLTREVLSPNASRSRVSNDNRC